MFEIQFDRLRRPYQMTTRELVELLESLGRLPSDFDPAPLLGLVEHPVEEVRLYAVKNLAKLKQPRLLLFFFEHGRQEPSTLVRREFVSAIGRLRVREIIPCLFAFLEDADPKVVLQAIRGLLTFREDPEVQSRLRSLHGHPNELIRRAIESLLRAEPTTRKGGDHVKSPAWLHNKIVNADVLEVLKVVPDESVHLTFTSPPYYKLSTSGIVAFSISTARIPRAFLQTARRSATTCFWGSGDRSFASRVCI